MANTITSQLRALGFTSKEIKKINNHCVYLKDFAFSKLAKVDIYKDSNGEEWLQLYCKNEWYGFLCLNLKEYKGVDKNNG